MDKEELIIKIKEKKELSNLPDSFVLDALDSIIKKLQIKEIKNLKKSEQKVMIKLVRAELRRHTGMFQISKKAINDRASLLKDKNFEELLKTHASTSERLDFYPKLKEIISSLHPSSILDLGCGLNPIALANSNVEYYAVDIQESEIDIIKNYFKNKNISGDAIVQDISKSLSGLPDVDLCLAFKLLDILEKKGHKQAENILKTIKCKNFIFSFSTKTLSGKNMTHQKRPWLERILGRIKYPYKTIKSDNEIFYIIDKI